AEHFTRLRVAAEPGLLEDGRAVKGDLEPAAAGWIHRDLGARMAFTNRSRQTDGTGFVVSNGAVFDRDAHAGLRMFRWSRCPKYIEPRRAPSGLTSPRPPRSRWPVARASCRASRSPCAASPRR